MPVDRFYCNKDIDVGQIVIIEGAEFQHLSKVVRKNSGESVELVNGKGTIATAVVKDIGRRKVSLLVEDVSNLAKDSHRIVLAQAIPKLNKLDMIVEKSTELGVDEIWLFPSSRSEKKYLTDQQLLRLDNLAVSAMKQCGRLHLPKIILKSFAECCSSSLDEFLYFGDVNPNAPFFMDTCQRSGSIVFFVGPEGGFDDREIDKLKDYNAVGVKLHRNILRTETASLVALGVIGQLF